MYDNVEQLLKAQLLLVELARHFTEYADEMKVEHTRDLYYKCLINICNRKELDLQNLQFDEHYEALFHNTNSYSFAAQPHSQSTPKNIQKKLKVAFAYQSFMYQTLKVAL